MNKLLTPAANHRTSSLLRQPLLVSPQTTVLAAIARMEEEGEGCVLVVEQNNEGDGIQLIGILTEKDLIRLSLQSTPLDQLSLQGVMSQPVITLQEKTLVDLQAVLSCFQNHSIRHLPILDDRDRLVGLLTQEALINRLIPEILSLRDAQIETQKIQLKQEQRYRILIDNANDAILWANDQGQLLEANRKAELLLGYSRDELRQMHISQIHPPEVLDLTRSHFQNNVIQHNLGETLDTLILRKDGTKVPVDINASRIELDGEMIAQGIFRDITERKQVEAERQKLTERLTLALQSGEIACWEWDLVTNTAIWDDRMYELYGIDRESDRRPTCDLFVAALHPDDRARVETRLQQAILGQRDYDIEFRVVHPDDSIRFIKAHGLVVRDAQGNAQSITGVNLDITTQKQSEQSLRDSQQFIQTLLDTLPLCVFWKNRKSVFLGCNQPLADLMGLSSTEEIIGKTGFEFSPTTTEADTYAKDDQWVITSGEPKWGIEETMTLPNGEQIWLETHKAPLRDGQGQIIGIVGVFRDVTARKQIAEDLKSERARLQLALDAAQMGAWSCNLATGKLLWSDRAQEIFGFVPGTFSGERSAFLSMVHPEDREQVIQAIAHTFSTKNPYCLEYRIYRLDGQIRWLSVWGILSPDQSSTEHQIIGVVADISDRKQAEAQLQQTNQELARATRLKDEFLANMSHELRTPLNVILGLTEGLQEQIFGELNEKQTQALQTIERGGFHLLELINDILDIAKIESGQMELHCAPTPVLSIFEASLTFIRQIAHRKQLQLEMRLPPDLPDLLVDGRRIRQVLINLLNNAVKFTPEGGRITLEVSPVPLVHQAEPAGEPAVVQNYLQIAVIDTGIGIAPENISRLFKPFMQIDGALNRKYEGTGLGLALVKQMVELHGGQVGLTSEVGVGSRFTIDLPCSTCHLPALPSPTMQTEDSPEPSRSFVILLADDSKANILSMASYLEAKGYQWLAAETGTEAIALIGAEKPDLVLMDIQMAGLDGLEAIKQIRLDPQLAQIPIIALTALAMEGDRERCLAAGANEYLSKPIKLKHITNLIQQLLDSP